ncbi:hypothetical protein [Leeia aquatica]|uniref:Uncharacterized protein n=1 Tax=Leeia aquatica TaxID=2725557 RepID=A0A847SHF6_9NEIS|nr:hypothetical protein [Leeia aquatica]NLR76609.1 hypothetical protein [Leeia aquatica]
MIMPARELFNTVLASIWRAGLVGVLLGAFCLLLAMSSSAATQTAERPVQFSAPTRAAESQRAPQVGRAVVARPVQFRCSVHLVFVSACLKSVRL